MTDDVLTEEQLAERLGVSVSTVQRADLPLTYLTPQTPRYLWSRVLEVLRERETTRHAQRALRGDVAA